jgi:hypothetical protein
LSPPPPPPSSAVHGYGLRDDLLNESDDDGGSDGGDDGGSGGGNDDGDARTARWSYNPLAEEDDEVEAEAGEESELTPDIPLDGFTSFANAASVSDPIPLEP